LIQLFASRRQSSRHSLLTVADQFRCKLPALLDLLMQGFQLNQAWGLLVQVFVPSRLSEAAAGVGNRLPICHLRIFDEFYF
jgi:hypothetical protein